MLTTDENLDFVCQSVRLCGDGTLKAARIFGPSSIQYTDRRTGLRFLLSLLCFQASTRRRTLGSSGNLNHGYQSSVQHGIFNRTCQTLRRVLTWLQKTVFLSKRMDLHVRQLGLMPKYQINMGFRTSVKCLATLAFIPVSDLVAVYESLSTTFLHDELPILHYFESTWIGMGVGAGGPRRDPAFPHQMWNVLDRHEQGSTRTTNALEAFHHSFNAPISCQQMQTELCVE